MQINATLSQQQRLFESIAEHANAVIGAKDVNGVYLYVNEEYSRLFGIPQAQFLGRSDADIFPPELAKSYRDADLHVLTTQQPKYFEERVLVDGIERLYLAAKFPIRDENNAIFATGLIATDITGRKALERKLVENEQRFRALFDSSPDPVWIVDNFTFVQCNQAAVDMLGYENRDSLLQTHPSVLSPATQPDGESSFAKANRMVEKAFADGINRFEWVHTRADGTDFWAEVTLSPFTHDGKMQIYCVWRDISEKKQMQREINQLAFYDALTNLPNRNLFEDRFRQAQASSQRTRQYNAMLFLDLDNFKSLNDNHGHSAGDTLLIEVSRRLQQCTREIDTVARFGGDEFVIIINDLNIDKSAAVNETKAIADKICRSLARPYSIPIKPTAPPQHAETQTNPQIIEHQCSASVGYTVFGPDKDSLDNVVLRSDKAMYIAKNNGRNCTHYLDSGS